MNNQLKLLELAQQAAKNAYAPYSKFCVGAAVLSSNNRFYSGCNVENISGGGSEFAQLVKIGIVQIHFDSFHGCFSFQICLYSFIIPRPSVAVVGGWN